MLKAEHLLQQLLFGLETALQESAKEFEKIVMEKFARTVVLNDKKIQLRCSEAQRTVEVKKLQTPSNLLHLEALQNCLGSANFTMYALWLSVN